MSAEFRAQVFDVVDDMVDGILSRVLDGGTMTREEQLATLRQLQQDRRYLRLATQRAAGEA